MTETLDYTDRLPTSGCVVGELLPGGLLAWERLGVGHRCETWLAWSRELWQPAVVKFPRPHQLDHPRARLSLQREVGALRYNLHPALPRLYVDGAQADVPFVVLEYVDGPALCDEIDDHGALGDLEVALLGVQVLAAVRAVHRRGVAHADIKPDNVVLRDGRPVLLDFGSARGLGEEQPRGKLIGSAGYAAPELEAGQPISAAMDVFGVGLTLWEARAGEPPFDPDIAAAQRSALDCAADSQLGQAIARLTAVEPTDRPDVDTALELLARCADPHGTTVWPDFARN